MIVIAKENKYTGLLTEGKEYEVISDKQGFFEIYNDKNQQRRYMKSLFKVKRKKEAIKDVLGDEEQKGGDTTTLDNEQEVSNQDG